LIDQHYVGEERARPENELTARLVEDVHADDVARHEIRRALDALELAAERARQRPGKQRLAQAGHALHEDVPARDERDGDGADRGLRTNHHASDLARQPGIQLLNGRSHVICLSMRMMRLCNCTSGTRFAARAWSFQRLSSSMS